MYCGVVNDKMADIMLAGGGRNENGTGDDDNASSVFREEALVSVMVKRLESAFYVSLNTTV